MEPRDDENRVQPSDVKKRLEHLARSGYRGNVLLNMDGRGIAYVREEHSAKTRCEFLRLVNSEAAQPLV